MTDPIAAGDIARLEAALETLKKGAMGNSPDLGRKCI
jgi:hypothetical protein